MKGFVPVASEWDLEPVPAMTYVGGEDDNDKLVPNS
jgi:hypothetical protein